MIYLYDGSFEGLLTAIFDRYLHRERVVGIESTENGQMSLGADYRRIETDTEKARRVADKIISIAGSTAYKRIYYTYLSELPEREINIAGFVRMCLKYGKAADRHMTVHCVDFVLTASHNTGHEAHKYTGFVRFSELDSGVFYGEIEPVHNVLPILAQHFVKRYVSLAFVLHDIKRHIAVVYDGRDCVIRETKKLPSLTYSEDEEYCRELWKQFYRTAGIKDCHNEKCRMTLMPKRYWRHLTEFDETPVRTIQNNRAQTLRAYQQSLQAASASRNQ